MKYTTSAEKNAFYISAVTHPLLIPLAGFVIFNKYNYTSFQGQPLYILLSVFIITVILLPAYFVFALKRSGYIASYEMETMQERRLPLLFTSGALLFNYYLMHRANMLQLYQWYFLSAAIAGIVSFVITLFYKISLHTIGIGYLFGLGLALASVSTADMRWYLMLMAILGGVVSYCRLLLRAHNSAQLYAGFAVGTSCSTGMLLFI